MWENPEKCVLNCHKSTFGWACSGREAFLNVNLDSCWGRTNSRVLKSNVLQMSSRLLPRHCQDDQILNWAMAMVLNILCVMQGQIVKFVSATEKPEFLHILLFKWSSSLLLFFTLSIHWSWQNAHIWSPRHKLSLFCFWCQNDRPSVQNGACSKTALARSKGSPTLCPTTPSVALIWDQTTIVSVWVSECFYLRPVLHQDKITGKQRTQNQTCHKQKWTAWFSSRWASFGHGFAVCKNTQRRCWQQEHLAL